MDEFEKSEMRETMSEVYDRMTAGAAEEEAEQEARRDYLGGLSEEELAKENRRQLEAIWDKHHGVKEDCNCSHEGASYEAPSHWTDEVQQKFMNLSPEAQELVLEHSGAIEQDLLQHYQSMRPTETDTKWESYLNQLGTTKDHAFDSMMALDQSLRYGAPEQKRHALWQMARNFGVDLLGPNATSTNPTAAVLHEQLRVMQNENQQRLQQQTVHRRQTNEQIVQSFRSRTVDGKKAHPHFDVVEGDMARLMSAGRANSLGEAYRIAVSLRPELRKRR